MGVHELLLVDVSNVCREVKPADWAVVENLLDVWEQEFGRPEATVLVADNSLRSVLARHRSEANERFRRLAAGGQLQLVPKADPVILAQAAAAIAAGRSVAVVSRDRYVAEADEFPWLIGDAEHFFSFDVDGKGQVAVRLAQMLMSRQTRAEVRERNDLKDQGFEGVDDPVLGRIWRCSTDSCWNRQLRPERLVGLPLKDAGEVLCPACRAPLEDLGPRPTRRRVEVGGQGGAGVLITAGEPVVFARRGDVDARVVGLDAIGLGVDLLDTLGPEEFVLEVRPDGRVTFTDRDPARTSAVERRAKKGVPVGAERVAGGAPVVLGPRDLLRVGGVVEVEQTGERNPGTVIF